MSLLKEITMAISKDKKRYYLSLTLSHVDRFQDLCKKLNLPPETMSYAVDDLIGNISDTLQIALDNRKVDYTDVFETVAKQMKNVNPNKRIRKVKGKNAEQKRNSNTRQAKM
jgi:hypothetical protein